MPKISELTDIGTLAFNDELPVLDTSESITKRINVSNLFNQFSASVNIITEIVQSIEYKDEDLLQSSSVQLAQPNDRIIVIWNLTNPNQTTNTEVFINPLDDNRFFVIFNNDATYSIDFIKNGYTRMYYNGALTTSITIAPLKILFGIAGSPTDDNLYILNLV
jgi:hypothetical protein